MSVTSDLIRIQEMKIYYLLSILIILLAVSTSQQRSIADGFRHREEAGAGATPWSVEHRHLGDRGRHREEAEAGATPWSVERRPLGQTQMSSETAEGDTFAEATPWP